MKHGFKNVLIVSGALIATVLVITVLYKEIKQQNALLSEKKNYEQKLSALNAERDNLTNQLKTTGQGESLENEARLTLGMKKPGEKVIILVPPKQNEGDTSSLKPKSFWNSIWSSLLTWPKNMWQNLFGHKGI